MEFDWDDANVEHIAQHGVRPKEVEEAMIDPRRLPMDAYNVRGEKRQALLGATEAGRLLVVHFTKRGGLFRPITARDANSAQKRRYRREK